jgi:type IV pilus assembly protein PilA
MSLAGRRGFTFLEGLIVLAMAAVLAAIGVPKFLEAQARARRSEVITELKRLHAGMKSLRAPPSSIHVPGFAPERGNRYSYLLERSCAKGHEDRRAERAVPHAGDSCIGVDVFAHPSLPAFFRPYLLPGPQWDEEASMNGLGVEPGLVSAGGIWGWDYLAYATGDTDGNLSDNADTWAISSAGGHLPSYRCQEGWVHHDLPEGEPFLVYGDAGCE